MGEVDRRSKSPSKGSNVLTRDGNAAEIMKQVHELYTSKEDGLVELARNVGMTIHPPRRKVNVLVIGNHSAGKSSFINWYIDDDIQRTGVAIETQGFSFITSGNKKTLAPIKGESTIMLYPYLQTLKEKFGKPLIENLNTSVSVSTARNFPLVDFIDSPGLVDGDISYPYDVNDAIFQMAEHADLIFVFLDPMGQALCSRTMRVVKMLNQKHFDKLRYYLTKADTVTTSTEMMKLMVQITQSIKENINNQHGLEIPAIWLPSRDSSSKGSVPNEVNQIQSVCDAIEKSIHQKVQDNLSQVEEDCKRIDDETKQLLHQNEMDKAARQSREIVAILFSVTAWVIPLMVFLVVVAEYEQFLPSAVTQAEVVMTVVKSIADPIHPLLLGDHPSLVRIAKVVAMSIAAFVALDAIANFTQTRTKKFALQPKSTIAKWRRHEVMIQEIAKKRQALFVKYVRTYTQAEDL